MDDKNNQDLKFRPIEVEEKSTKDVNISKEASSQPNEGQSHENGGSTIKDFDYAGYSQVENNAVRRESATALVLGILAVISNALISFLIPVGLGVVGIVFALQGLREEERKGLAIWGMVLSILGILIAAIVAMVIAADLG